MVSKCLFFILIFGLFAGCAEGAKCLAKSFNMDKEVCCYGKIYDKVVDGHIQSCCTGANKMYDETTQVCCGYQILNKTTGFCCENHFRDFRDGGMCCNDEYYEHGPKYTGCCGKTAYHSATSICCDGKVHEKGPHLKCCGEGIFNKETQWCKKKKYVLNKTMDTCNGYQYNTTTHVCCHDVKYIVEKTDKDQDQCCGKVPFNSNKFTCTTKGTLVLISKTDDEAQNYESKCGQHYLKKKEDCCNDTKPFDPQNYRCCGDKVINKSQQCCDDKPLPEDGSYVCCRSVTRQKQVLQLKNTHDKCCFLKNGSTQTYDGNVNACNLGEVIPNIRRCGIHAYNIRKDLCCSGVYFQNGILQNLRCCGIRSYNNYQICISGTVKDKSKIRGNPSKCPSYCHKSWIRNFQFWDPALLKKGKEICKYKMIKLLKINGTSWKVTSNRKKGKIVKFKEDSTCTCGCRKRLTLVYRKITKSGEIEGQFYLLAKRYRNIFRSERKNSKCKKNRKKKKQMKNKRKKNRKTNIKKSRT